ASAVVRPAAIAENSPMSTAACMAAVFWYAVKQSKIGPGFNADSFQAGVLALPPPRLTLPPPRPPDQATRPSAALRYPGSMSEHTPDQRQPHSAEFFNDMREFWWNLDFLQLMAQRLDLARVASMLDVGCGVGHWGRALAQVLPATAQITGVDFEEKWVQG